MTHKAITLKFVVLTVLAVALGTMISVGVVHLEDRHPVAIDREANPELPKRAAFARSPVAFQYEVSRAVNRF
jgi:hypothetical protein